MMRRGDRITEVWAFICLDESEDCEGIPAMSGPHPDGNPAHQLFMPLIGADPERVKALMPMVQDIARATKKKIRLVRFTGMEEIQEVKP